MLKEVDDFLQYVNNNGDLLDNILEMSTDDFAAFIKTSGFSFTLDEFVKAMREVDNNQYLNNVELSDEELNMISAGKTVNPGFNTLSIFKKFLNSF